MAWVCNSLRLPSGAVIHPGDTVVRQAEGRLLCGQVECMEAEGGDYLVTVSGEGVRWPVTELMLPIEAVHAYKPMPGGRLFLVLSWFGVLYGGAHVATVGGSPWLFGGIVLLNLLAAGSVLGPMRAYLDLLLQRRSPDVTQHYGLVLTVSALNALLLVSFLSH